MKIALGTDHAGYDLKEVLKSHLVESGHEVVDFGTDSPDRCDYPDFVFPAAKAVADGECDRAIVLGGSGNGEAMAANRVVGVRCALCWTVETARLGREHNDANCISLGARLIDEPTAKAIVDTWLTSDFEAGRHVARIEKLDRPPA